MITIKKYKIHKSSPKNPKLKNFNPEIDDLATFLLYKYDSHMGKDSKLHKRKLKD